MEKTPAAAKPYISIVVPVYKVAEEFLRQSIECCLEQTCPDWELILVDDGSPDQCGTICDSYSKIDPRIKVLHQENGGVSRARNAGIAAATGEWITFLDADDFFEPTTCHEIRNCVEKDPDLDLVIFSMVKNYQERVVPNVSLYGCDRTFAAAEEVQQLRADVLAQQLDRNILRMTFCKAVRTRILRDNGIIFEPKLPMCEDVVFWFATIQHVNKAHYMDRHLYHYRQVENSATDRYRKNVVQEHEDLLSCLKGLVDASDAPQRYLQGYCLEVFYSMQRMITQNFFHKDNPQPWLRRSRECAKVLGQPLYRQALKALDPAELTKNHKIKYLLLRLRLYGAVSYLRLLYGGLTGRTTDKGAPER